MLNNKLHIFQNTSKNDLHSSECVASSPIFRSLEKETDQMISKNSTAKVFPKKSTKKTRANKTQNMPKSCEKTPPSRRILQIGSSAVEHVGNTSELSSIDEGKGLNFSEFDKYSLIISDSGPDLHSVPPTPEIDMCLVDTSQNTEALTSTPHGSRLQPKAALYNSLIRDSDLSHIDIVVESPEPVASRTRGQLSFMANGMGENNSVMTGTQGNILYDVPESVNEEEEDHCPHIKVDGASASVQDCVRAVGQLSLSQGCNQSEFNACSVLSPKSPFRTYNVSARFRQGIGNLELPVISSPSHLASPNTSERIECESSQVGEDCQKSLQVCFVKLQQLSVNFNPDSSVSSGEYNCGGGHLSNSLETPVVSAAACTATDYLNRPRSDTCSSDNASKSMFDSTQNSPPVTDSQVFYHSIENSALPAQQQAGFPNKQLSQDVSVDIQDTSESINVDDSNTDSIDEEDDPESGDVDATGVESEQEANSCQETKDYLLETIEVGNETSDADITELDFQNSVIDISDEKSSSQEEYSVDSSVSLYMLADTSLSLKEMPTTHEDIKLYESKPDMSHASYTKSRTYFSCDSKSAENSSNSGADDSMENSITIRRKPKNKLLANIKEDLETSCNSIQVSLINELRRSVAVTEIANDYNLVLKINLR